MAFIYRRTVYPGLPVLLAACLGCSSSFRPEKPEGDWDTARLIVSLQADRDDTRINATRAFYACLAEGKLLQTDRRIIIPFLVANLQSRDTVLQIETIVAIGASGSDAQGYLLDLSEFLGHRDEDMREKAVLAYGRVSLGTNLAVKSLVRVLSSDPADSVRLAAVRALEELGISAQAAVPYLVKARKDEHHVVRNFAIAAILSCGRNEEEALACLRDILAQGSDADKGLLLRAMRREGFVPESLQSLVREMGNSSNPEIRGLARLTEPKDGR